MKVKPIAGVSLGVLFLISILGTVHAEQGKAWREFVIDGHQITVAADAVANGKRAYQIVVLKDGLTVSRLVVNRDGVLNNAWKTDLDGDGKFEVTVTVDQLEGGSEGTVDIHEWDQFKFDSTRVHQAIAAERGAYRGHDQYRLADGQLIREFPRFTRKDGVEVPSGGRASYRWDASVKDWIAK